MLHTYHLISMLTRWAILMVKTHINFYKTICIKIFYHPLLIVSAQAQRDFAG